MYSQLGAASGFMIAFNTSHARLRGFRDNGLRWHIPDQKVSILRLLAFTCFYHMIS